MAIISAIEPSINPEQLIAAVQRVHAAKPELAKVLEMMDDKSGEEMCKIVTSVFVPALGQFSRIPFHVDYMHAMFEIAPFDADPLAIAVVDELIAAGADATAAVRIRETCTAI